MSNKIQKTVLTLALFTAGISFLVYEVVWDRMLSLYLGITVHASTIVVASYMAGLAIGSYIFGKAGKKSRNKPLFTGLLIIVIGIINLAVYYLLGLVPHISAQWAAYSYSLIIVFLSAVTIGGVMPLVSAVYVSLGSSSSDSIGNTFAADTIGSSVGGILAGFFLLGNLGMQSSVILMTFLNIFTGILIIVLIKGKVNEENSKTDKENKKLSRKKKGLILSGRSVTLIVFVTGLTGLTAQILWMRIFRIYLTNSSYTFSLIVSVVIFGYFLGSIIFKKFFKKDRNASVFLLRSFLIFGLIYIWGVTVFVFAPEVVIIPLHETLRDPALRILLPPVLLSFLTVLPQSVFSGLVFTSAVEVYNKTGKKMSEGFGSIYFYNTAGAFIGPFLAAFVLIPYAGVVRSLTGASFISIITLFYVSKKERIKDDISSKSSVVFSLILAGALFIPRIKIMPPSFSKTDREILFYKETTEATLTVGEDKETGLKYTYFNNNSVMGSSYDAVKAVKLLGHIPFLTSHDPENVLIVGFGIGVTASTVLMHPEVKSVKCIELAEELKVAAAFYSDLNRDVVNDPRLEIIGNDGRNFLQNSNEKYDLISSDPTHPVLGSGNLYSQEYFQLCYDHLTDKGMVTQYLPVHKLLLKDYKGIIKTFNSVFENTTLWLGHTHTILVGTKEPLSIDFVEFAENASEINDQYIYNNPYSLASFFIFDKAAVTEFSKGAEICYDDRSYLDFFDFDSFLPQNWNINAKSILEHIQPADPVSNIPDPQKLSRFRHSTKLVLAGLIKSMSGDRQGYINKLLEAYRSNPENQEISFLIKLEQMKKGN